jgi:hypothetical protein
MRHRCLFQIWNTSVHHLIYRLIEHSDPEMVIIEKKMKIPPLYHTSTSGSAR